jgi:hypothetical protein
MTSQLVLLESRTAREDRLSDVTDDRALETINKAKALLMASWQGTGIATTAQMAEYYEVPEDTVKKVYQRNNEEFASDGVKVLKGKDLGYVRDILSLSETRRTSLMTWTPRAALRLGMLLRDSEIAQQVRTVILDVAEQQPAAIADLAKKVAELEQLVIKSIATKPQQALPKASVDPVPGEITPMTERDCINRLIRGYVSRKNQNLSEGADKETEQKVTRWMYLELKIRHKFDAYARLKNSKHKTKIALIEAEGYLPQLHAICNHFLGN